jgi:hypothetical protein
MMKVTVMEKGAMAPDESGYLVGKNGLYARVVSNWVEGVVPVKSIPVLEEIVPRARFILPRFPASELAKILAFFHEVDEEHSSEAAVMIHYGEKKGWVVTCPEQDVGPGFVDYEMTDRVEGTRCLGTMHSHVRMSAFHSGTDLKDEEVFDGVHVTIGHVHKLPVFDCSIDMRVRGFRFTLRPEQFFEGVVPKTLGTSNTAMAEDARVLLEDGFPEEWMSQLTVSRPATGWRTWGGSSGSYGGSTYESKEWVIHKKGEPPGRYNYDGAEWDKLKTPYNPGFHYSEWAANDKAKLLTDASGVEFVVSERPERLKEVA